MSKIPIKFAGGLDSNNQRITNVGYPINDGDAINLKYLSDQGMASTSEVSYVNVIDIISTDPSSPVTKTITNGIFIKSASTAAEDIKIVLRFGKSFSSTTLPNVETLYSISKVDDFSQEGLEDANLAWESLFTFNEMNNFDFTDEEQSLTNGDIKILELDYIQTFEFEYLVEEFEPGYYYFKNGGNITEIQMVTLAAPEILSAQIINDYETGQSEMSNGKNYIVSVTSDSNIKEVEIKGTYVTEKTEVKTSTNLTETISTTVKNGPINTDTGTKGYFEIRVKDANDTWSDWYNSSNSGVDSDKNDYLVINNTAPTFSGVSIAYSNTPLTALNLYSEDSSEATVTLTPNYLGTGGAVTGAATGGSGLTITKVSNAEFKMRAGSATYKYNTNTAILTATRAKNGRTSTQNIQVNIASQDMVIGNISVNTFRSSAAGYTTTFNLTGTNQQVRTRTLSLGQSISGLTLENQGTISGVNVNNASIKVTDASVKGTYNNLLEVELEGLSGRKVTKNFTIISKGFVERTLSSQNLSAPIVIPKVTTIGDLVVQVGDAGSLETCHYFYTATPTPGFQGDAIDQVMEYCVYESSGTWYITFDNNVFAKAGPGGWLNNARIVIEETI